MNHDADETKYLRVEFSFECIQEPASRVNYTFVQQQIFNFFINQKLWELIIINFN